MAQSGAVWRGRSLQAALFDLDGTLIDTVHDIARALNDTLTDFELEPIPVDDVRQMVGRGSPMLIERAASMRGRAPDATAHAAMLERFFHHYETIESSVDSTARPFAGAEAALAALHRAGVRNAVVTNKHHRFAVSLMSRLGLAPYVDLVIGGDSCPERKPHPGPLLFACRALQAGVADSLMVGDSANDTQAARGAGMPVVCVSYGYNEGRDPRTLDCDALLDSLAELPPLLGLN